MLATVILRDILEREKRRGQRQITNAVILRKMVLFLADNIDSTISDFCRFVRNWA